MSFWKNMFTGGEGHSVAHNAHLAELVIEKVLPASRRREVAQSLVRVMRRGWEYRDLEEFQIVMAFNEFSRITQLNMLSIAMKELGICWPGEQWMPIRNPIYNTMDAKDIEVNAGYFKRKHGLTVTIKSQPMNLLQWMEE